MSKLLSYRRKHQDIKIQLLRLSKKIDESEDLEDIIFYQELCERYAIFLKSIEKKCNNELGITICTNCLK
ncbi:hypothetical protein ACFQ3J_07010 [Paenibacillus provencensis]|uniref:Uncharacterized protein n=1 Tax=Paenibacillus provencensis TaxID=441151 RepID=A0ABW3PU29_9BACL|nr:hypothetical protein [Paenibacillus sp. MER 78]MCM3129705.1 hypothetical protein [Paenibacillus sp. MER 78]SFS54868.1 hypothetical protein SAMN04488601_1011569 [Paenibacillus sp. 453mf]